MGEIRTYIPPESTTVAWRNLTAIVVWLLRDGKGSVARRIQLIERLRKLADQIERGERLS